jgi:hypothetical protein
MWHANALMQTQLNIFGENFAIQLASSISSNSSQAIDKFLQAFMNR